MNEELRIVISAITNEAQRNLAEVRQELNNIDGAGKQAGKDVDAAMRTMGKAVGATVAAVAALTTAMAALGKKAQEVNKGIARLNSTFESAGSSAAQATDTYRELFGIFGDHDRAIETAQSLARITTEAGSLAEYYDILAGAAAKYGDGLQGEALAEQISETVASGKAVGDLARVLVEAGISEDAFNNSLAQTTSLEQRELLVRQTLNGVLGATGSAYRQANAQTIAYNKSQADLNVALAQASAYTTPLLTALNVLSTTLLTNLAPAFRTVSLYLTGFIELMAEAVEWIGGFFGVVGGGSAKSTADIQGYQEAISNYNKSLREYFGATESGADGAIDSIQKLKKQTMGFDELNVVSSNPATTGAGGGGSSGGGLGNMPTAPDPSDFGIGGDLFDTEQLAADLENVKEKIKGIGVLVGLVAAGLVAWKIGSFIGDVVSAKNMIAIAGEEGAKAYQKAFGAEAQKTLDGYKTKATNIAGALMIVAGAVLLVDGYSKAWADGVDWANLAEMIAGVGLIVGGVALTIGGVAAPIALIVGAIALLVVGIKDLVENGYSMEAVILIAVAAIGILIGVVWAFNAALLANPITWIVVAIMALVAAFVVLWNECEGFRNFWIAVWEKVKVLFAAFVESLKPLINAIVGAFKEAWEVIKIIWNDYLVPLFKAAWEAIKVVWNAVKPYFQMVWENIKAIFTVVKEVLSAFFKAAWEAIKIVWNQVVSYFTAIWETIKGIFSVVKNVLSGNWQGAWDAIKGIVGTWSKYFSNTWENIKKVFSVVKTFFTTAFSSAWEGVKKIFNNVSTFFTGVRDSIKQIFSNIGSAIGNAITNTVKTAINGVLSTAVKIINGFISAINLAINIINKIPGVNITKLEKLNVPKLATGGILTAESLFIGGEGGKKEAVLPLEQNTGWMDILADRINSRSNTPTKIVLALDGKELGYATINSINNITRQTGTLQLALV